MSSDVRSALSNLSKELQNKGIPVVFDPNFYPDDVDVPYLALGEQQVDKINRLHLRMQKHVYAKNKSMFSIARRHIREFYRTRKGVKSRNKIVVVETPDNSFTLKIFNRGFKFINPYLVQEKSLKKDRKSIRKFQKQLDIFEGEFAKLSSYIQRQMKVSQKNKYNKLKASSQYRGPVAFAALALAATMPITPTLVHTHYNDDDKNFPYVELKIEPKDSDWQSMERLMDLHVRKNTRFNVKLQRYLNNFYKNRTSTHKLVVGLPAGYGCLEENKRYNDMLGIFALYNTNMMNPEKYMVEEVRAFTQFIK